MRKWIPTGNSDHIVVSNTATINGGTVIVQARPSGFTPSNTIYTILTATNGVSGMYVTSSIVMPTWVQSANTLFPLTGRRCNMTWTTFI